MSDFCGLCALSPGHRHLRMSQTHGLPVLEQCVASGALSPSALGPVGAGGHRRPSLYSVVWALSCREHLGCFQCSAAGKRREAHACGSLSVCPCSSRVEGQPHILSSTPACTCSLATWSEVGMSPCGSVSLQHRGLAQCPVRWRQQCEPSRTHAPVRPLGSGRAYRQTADTGCSTAVHLQARALRSLAGGWFGWEGTEWEVWTEGRLSVRARVDRHEPHGLLRSVAWLLRTLIRRKRHPGSVLFSSIPKMTCGGRRGYPQASRGTSLVTFSTLPRN